MVRSHLVVSKRRLALQVSFAIVYLMLVLLLLDTVVHTKLLWAVGASSLASSAYLVFSLPDNLVSSPKRIIIGYLIAIFCGEAVRWGLISMLCLYSDFHAFAMCLVVSPHMYWLCGAFAVGLSIIVMALLDYQHPPAAGFALALVVELNHYRAILVILLLVFLLAFIRFMCHKFLKNLV